MEIKSDFVVALILSSTINELIYFIKMVSVLSITTFLLLWNIEGGSNGNFTALKLDLFNYNSSNDSYNSTTST